MFSATIFSTADLPCCRGHSIRTGAGALPTILSASHLGQVETVFQVVGRYQIPSCRCRYDEYGRAVYG
jgi:hypothetical protein